MSDACGCSDDETTPGGEEAEEHEAERLWEVSELRFAAVAGVLLVAGLLSAVILLGAGGRTVGGALRARTR